ncbi:hypothetical protein [Herbiconiux sp. UC225_62]|uniref:hypothetical protein n=1 Tax=Herbiconiux sp. UC225_62 TaxID=3350168 RepID=UPI0036D30452
MDGDGTTDPQGGAGGGGAHAAADAGGGEDVSLAAGGGADTSEAAGSGAGDADATAGGGADVSPAAGGGAGGAEVAAAGLRVVLEGVVRGLVEAGARTEALGAFEQRRSILGVRRGPVLVPKGRVWRLGVLLLDAQGGLHEVGAVTRAVDPGRVTNQSPRAEERRDYRRAAYQGKFERGDTVNYDAKPVALDADSLRADGGLLSLDGDTVMVRWNKQPGAAGLTPLVPYLTERATLLTAPPP